MRKSVLRTLLVLTALLTVGGLIGSAQVLAADAGWLSGWANRMAITIDHSRISSSLTNFPVMINISSASGTNSANISNIFNILGNNSKKLAVTTSDGLTQCNVEVARWDSTNKQAVLWVNVPSISSSVDTVIYLYYDNSHVDNTTMVGDTGSAPAEKVWDSNFVGVWHLTQSGNGTAGEFKDSTNRHHDGQGAGGLGYGNPTLTTSNTPMGAAQSFNGKNAYINVPDCDDFSITTTNNLTVSCWLSLSTLVQPTSTGGYTRYIGKSSAGQHEWFSEVYDYNSSYNRSQWISNYVLNPSGGLGAGDYSSGSFGVNDWLYITNTFHGNSPTSGWENIYRGPAIRTG